jgi:hypothetical protein
LRYWISHIELLKGARTIRRCALACLGAFLAAAPAAAQLNVTGQASAAYVQSGDGPSQYAYNNGRGTFTWRGDVFADAILSDNISFMSNIRMLQDEVLHVDLLALRFSGIASTPVNAEAGEIDIPFGNLGVRRFPKTNPFLNLPLIYEHLTSLRSSNYMLWVADSRFTAAGDGIHILDGGLYDLGAKVYATFGMFDFFFAVTNGMESATSGYYQGGLNTNRGVGKTFRVAMTPSIGLTLGLSYAFGPFMSEGTYYGVTYDPLEYQQRIAGADLEFSSGHFSCYGEFVFNTWALADIYGSDLQAAGYTFEAAYTVVPRLSVAARAGGLSFNSISAVLRQSNYIPGPYDGPWDHDQFRLEGSIGYRVSREVLLKAVGVLNRTLGVASDPPDNVIGIQTVASF